MIRPEDLIEKFRQAIEDNWGYIWGTAGVKWTKAKQEALEKTTDEDRALSRKYGSKWIGHMVADCSGLFTCPTPGLERNLPCAVSPAVMAAANWNVRV